MTRSFHRFFILLVLFTGAGTSAAQVQTGTPPFGSFGGGPDVINLANLNSRITIPVRHKAGRGTNFDYDLKYDSSVWYPVNSGGVTSWQPASTQWGWDGLTPAGQSAIFYSMTYLSDRCGPDGSYMYQEWMFGNFVYVDIFGTQHTFNYNPVYFNSPGGSGCPPNGPQPPTVQPTLTYDGSGYTLYATPGAGSASAYLVDRSGSVLHPPVMSNPPSQQGSTSRTDRHGNQITSSNGTYTDTLGQTALSVIGSAPSNTTISFTPPSGPPAPYTVSYHGYIIRTYFNCSAIAEYNSGSTLIYLVDKVTLPDGSYYQFAYEPTPTFAGDVTGRIATVTLPTGGTISYQYSGGGTGVNGITCADGSAATLTRTTPDGSWTYARTFGSGAASTTTITDPTPQGNQTVIQFQGIYETQRQVYQGSSSGTLLKTINTCYNGSSTPCTGTAVSLPITQRAVNIQLPGAANLQCQHVYSYNGFGVLTEQDDYDYGSGAVGALLKKTTLTYGSLGNIHAFRQTVTVQDGASPPHTIAQTNYNYDETAVVATSGTPQHTSVSGSRGNLTSINYYTQGSTYLTKTFTYFDTGNVQTVTDVNNAASTYTYGACGNSFITNVSEPLSLSKSMVWNCTGGVQTSVTDENNQTTSTAYTDLYFWRPASLTDPANAVLSFNYLSETQKEETIAFNSGNSAVDEMTTLDAETGTRVEQL